MNAAAESTLRNALRNIREAQARAQISPVEELELADLTARTLFMGKHSAIAVDAPRIAQQGEMAR